jgi:hypothetical protein
MSEASDPLPELRASDADRERIVEVLRRAASDGRLTVAELEERVPFAYAARTRSELEQLTADLGTTRLEDEAPPTGGTGEGQVSVRDGPGGTRWVVSIMGGHDKRGRWRIGRRATVLNIMGGSDIDLNDAELSGPVTDLTMVSIMGGGTIRVPHGVDVQVSNFAFMGGNDAKLGDEVAPPGAPTIHVRLVSIMGGSDVVRGRKLTKEQRRRERELRDARREDLEP